MAKTRTLSTSDDLPRRLDEALIRALHALLTETAVSRAALKLGIQQPAMSRQLKALRELTGDQLLVRVGNRMVLTERGESLTEPTRRILNDLSQLSRSGGEFTPESASHNFRVASYDFLPSAFYADVVGRVLRASPGSRIVWRGIPQDSAYLRQLSDGDIDLAIVAWPELPGHFRASKLLNDDIVCIVRKGHPLTRERLTLDSYARARHLSALEQSTQSGDLIDTLLVRHGVSLDTVVRTQYFGLMPEMLLESDLVLTTGSLFGRCVAARFPLVVLPFPAQVGPLRYRLVWHERTHQHRALVWLRNEMLCAARKLAAQSGA